MVTRLMLPAARPPSSKELAWVGASALLPVLVAASQLDLYADGGRDAGVIETVGMGYAGGLRAVDGWLAAVFAALPIGTRTLRAELPGVLLVGAMAALVFVVVRRALVAAAGPSPWSSVVACIASATVSCSYGVQHEASSAASGLLGVVLVLVVLALPAATAGWPLLAGLFTLGLSYDPLIGVCVAVAAGARVFVSRTAKDGDAAPRTSGLELGVAVVLAAVAGLVPFVLAAIHARVSSLSTSAPLFAWPAGRSLSFADGSLRHAAVLVEEELGGVLLLLSAGGFVLGLLVPRARRENLRLAAVTVAATLMLILGGGGTREAWSPVGLVALVGYVAFAAVSMHEGVRRVSKARLPLASASAAMVVLLEAAFPAIALDDGLARAGARPPLALASWEDTAFAGVPSGSLLLVSSPRLYERLLATRASGDLPGDLSLLPTFDPKNEASASALARDARLVPLFRDIALTGVPQELSLSNLTLARPLVVATDPRWDRTLTRHLLPAGLLALFEPEPRGGSDRKHALEATAPARAALAVTLTGTASSPGDAPLTSLTTALLLDRAVAAVQTGEREVALEALQEAYQFAPKDARIAHLIFREANSRGPVDAHELLSAGLASGPQ